MIIVNYTWHEPITLKTAFASLLFSAPLLLTASIRLRILFHENFVIIHAKKTNLKWISHR